MYFSAASLNILEELEKLRQPHYRNEEDDYYSCPKTGENLDKEEWFGKNCDCGADAHNAILDNIILKLRK